jgi:MoaA/NifB/PqqE/SkfB family radical SAM enzyme
MKKSFQKVSKRKQSHFLASFFWSYFSNRSMSLYSITLEITDRCNARCSFCSRWKSFNEMESETVKKIIKEAKQLKCWWVSLTGGEPLFHKNFREILSYCDEVGMKVSIDTNGYLLAKYSDLIIKNKSVILGVNVSLHSANAKKHNKIMGISDGYQKIMKGIKKLKNKVNLKIATTITQENIEEMDKIAELSKDLGVSHRFQPVHDEALSSLRPWQKGMSFEKNQQKKKEITKYINQYLSKYNPEYKLRIYYKLFPEFLINPERLKRLRCQSAARKIYFISPIGDVFPCETRRDIYLGNINKQTLRSILNSKKAKRWREICKSNKNNCVCLYACITPMNIVLEFIPWILPLNLQSGFPASFFWNKKIKQITRNYHG